MATIKTTIPNLEKVLELRNCHEVIGHDDSLPFNADIYVDGIQVGCAWDDGWGGEGEYRSSNAEGQTVLEEIDTELKRHRFLKQFDDSFWRLPLLCSVMAEFCICHHKRTFTIGTF